MMSEIKTQKWSPRKFKKQGDAYHSSQDCQTTSLCHFLLCQSANGRTESLEKDYIKRAVWVFSSSDTNQWSVKKILTTEWKEKELLAT